MIDIGVDGMKSHWIFAAAFFLFVIVYMCVWMRPEKAFSTSEVSTLQHKDPRNVLTVSIYEGRRLGNHMFNLASVLGIARKNNMQIRLNGDFDELLEYFQLNFTRTLPRLTANETDNFHIYEKDRRHVCDNNTQIFYAVKMNIEMLGSFNCFSHFTNVEDLIRAEFKPKEEHRRSIIRFFNHHTPPSFQGHLVARVGIHIRRGDFVHNQFGFSPADDRYFKHAMNYMMGQLRGFKVLFIVASDDIGYAKRVIVADNVVFSPFEEAALDMILLSLCDHVISSTGTFSFWGGWLSGGIVTYYKNFPRPGSMLSHNFQPEQFYPPEWVAME